MIEPHQKKKVLCVVRFTYELCDSTVVPFLSTKAMQLRPVLLLSVSADVFDSVMGSLCAEISCSSFVSYEGCDLRVSESLRGKLGKYHKLICVAMARDA